MRVTTDAYIVFFKYTNAAFIPLNEHISNMFCPIDCYWYQQVYVIKRPFPIQSTLGSLISNISDEWNSLCGLCSHGIVWITPCPFQVKIMMTICLESFLVSWIILDTRTPLTRIRSLNWSHSNLKWARLYENVLTRNVLTTVWDSSFRLIHIGLIFKAILC